MLHLFFYSLGFVFLAALALVAIYIVTEAKERRGRWYDFGR